MGIRGKTTLGGGYVGDGCRVLPETPVALQPGPAILKDLNEPCTCLDTAADVLRDVPPFGDVLPDMSIYHCSAL